MSMMGGPPAVTGEKVAEYASYEAAQKAVSTLIAADIPAREIAIVGSGLRSVETVTGRLGYATAARTGAINGILLGLIFSLIFVFGTPDAAIQLFLGVMLVGVAIGMMMSLVMFALVRRRRDFASVTQVVADHYEVTVQASSIHRARGALNVAATRPAAPAAPVPDGPPRYGERIDPVPAPSGDRPAPGPAAPSGAPAGPPSGVGAPGPADAPLPPATGPAPGGEAPGPELPETPAPPTGDTSR
ncbi:general stress protein [Microbacterium arborescens]|uniref:general stress protein n=1 Tax=Microbacterium arborescens TaxID=33883 RepID=UPI003C753E3F